MDNLTKGSLKILVVASLLMSGIVNCPRAEAGADAYMGEIIIVGTNFCPRGSIEANGQLLSIEDNSALFSLFGTLYGGDGRTTFGLPDLRGRAAIHSGQGPGLTNRVQGQKGGQENVEGASGNLNMAIGLPYLALRYCVVFSGIYPSRN